MKVHRYITKDNVKTYTDTELGIKIFQDDTCEMALSKISLGIAHITGDSELSMYLPYAWWRKRAVRFIEFQAAANPWDYTPTQANAKVEYANDAPFDFENINVVFYKDLPNLSSVYFPDVPGYIIQSSYKSLQRESEILDKVYYKDPVPSMVFTKVRFLAKDVDLPVVNMYHGITADTFNQFVQLVIDDANIQYKVFDYHNIPEQAFSQWTNHDYIHKSSSSTLVLMFKIPNKQNFAKVTIDKDIIIQYSFDSRDKVDWDTIEQHKSKIIMYLQNVTKSGKINISQASVAAKVDIPQETSTSMSLSDMAKVMSKLTPIYHILRVQDDVIYAIFKRSLNYKRKTDISDFIASRVALGVSMDEIIEDLVDLGMTKSDVSLWIEQFKNAENTDKPPPTKKVSINSSGCLMKISNIPYGFRASIENVATTLELQRAVRWVVGTTKVTLKSQARPPPPPPSKPPKKVKGTIKPPPKEEPPIIHEGTNEDTNEGTNDDDLLLGEELVFNGGAAGKANQRHFLTILRKADSNLIDDFDNYARKCAANNFRQPVALSPSSKAAIDAAGYDKSYDNAVLYGSDTEHMNYYMCPRIWCPVSQVPLTQEQHQTQGCPKGEEPILAYKGNYWGDDPNKPHYMNLLNKKNKSKQGFCLPCCGIRPMKQDNADECIKPNIEKEQEPESKETYILNAAAPIDQDRYGVIPSELHDILLPDISYVQICSKTLSSQPCFVRKGIHHGSDSFMASVATLLGFSTKGQLVKYISDNLDPITLLSTNIPEAFAPPSAISLTDTAKKQKWQKWAGRAYSSLVEVSSRELGLYTVYRNYIDFLLSPDPKNIAYVEPVIAALFDVTLVVAKKNDNGSVSLQCPIMPRETKFIGILVRDGNYYEPVEFKARRKQGMFKVPFAQYSKLLDNCKKHTESDVTIEKVRGLACWIDTILVQPDACKMTSIVLRQDLSVKYIITKSNLIIEVPTIPSMYIKDLVTMLGIKRILYHEDIANKLLNTPELYLKDYTLLIGKIQRYGFGVITGVSIISGYSFRSTIRVPSLDTTLSPILLSDTVADLVTRYSKVQAKDRKWYHLQLAIGRFLLKKHSLSHKQALVKELVGMFKEQRTIEAILDSIPLNKGHEGIKKWLNELGIEKRAEIIALDHPIRRKHQWMFSQAAVDTGLPEYVIKPTKVMRPRLGVGLPDIKQRQNILKDASPSSLPSLLKHTASNLKKLPSKFTQMKTYSWADYRVITKEFSDELFLELLEYISQYVNIPVMYQEVQLGTSRIVSELLRSKDRSLLVMNDPSMVAAWSKALGKKFPKGVDELWTKGISKMSYIDRITMWKDISLKGRNLFIMEIDLYTIAKLLDINIVVIHRSKYGKSDTGIKRGDMEDLALSTTFFKARTDWRKRIVCMFYKDQNETRTQFHPILDANHNFIQVFDTLPSDIRTFFEHLYNIKKMEDIQ